MLWEVVAALLFIGSSGLLFNEHFRQNRFMVLVAGTVALVATYFLTEQIVTRTVDERIETERSNSGSETGSTVQQLAARPQELSDSADCPGQYFTVQLGETLCGYSLNTSRQLEYRGRVISEPLCLNVCTEQFAQEAWAPDPVWASEVEIYSASPIRNYRLMVACGEAGIECKLFAGKPDEGVMTDLRFALRGGWQVSPSYWSPSGRFALISTNYEGMMNIVVADFETGNTFWYPDISREHEFLFAMIPGSLVWAGPQTIEVHAAYFRWDEWSRDDSRAESVYRVGAMRQFVFNGTEISPATSN